MRVELTDVIDAIDNADDLHTYCYCVPYEEILIREFKHYVGHDLPEDFDEQAEEMEFIELPDRREINDYANMEKFAQQYEDEEIAEWLTNSLKGKGAFRRFRAVLERFTIEEEWYDFLELQHRVLAMEWCEEHGIEYHDDTLRFEKPENLPKAAPSQSTPSYRMININDDNYMNLVFMAADFHKDMRKARGLKNDQDELDAQYNLEDRLEYGDILFAAGDHGRFLGYAVLQSSGNDLALVELYVRPDQRRKGIASLLFEEAERRAKEQDSELICRLPYGNRIMFSILKKHGYTTLLPLEVRRTTPEDSNAAEASVGDAVFRL